MLLLQTWGDVLVINTKSFVLLFLGYVFVEAFSANERFFKTASKDRQRRWKTSFHTEILSVRSTVRIKRFFDLVGRSVHLNFCLGALMDLSLTPVSQDSYWMTRRWSEKHWASLKIPNSWFSQVTSAIIQRYSYNTGNTETQAAKWPVTYTCEYSL